MSLMAVVNCRRAAVRCFCSRAAVHCRTIGDDVEKPGHTPKPSPGVREEKPLEEKRRVRKPPGKVSVLLFPGQGSQFVGMGTGLLKYGNVKDMFTVAEKVLGYDLLSLCLNGPEEDLMKTVHCQPAVFVTSLAAVERLNHESPAVSVQTHRFLIKTKGQVLYRDVLTSGIAHAQSHVLRIHFYG